MRVEIQKFNGEHWKAILVFGFVLLSPFLACGQDLSQPKFYRWYKWHADNPSVPVLQKLIIKARVMGVDTLPRPQLAAELAKLSLGTPYASGTTAGINLNYKPIFNWVELDCFTLVDNCLALAAALKEYPVATPTDSDFVEVGASYFRHLENIRYRNGRATDFASRLHYAMDFIADNAMRGRWKNMTSIIGVKYLDSVKATPNVLTARMSKAAGFTGAEVNRMFAIEDSLGRVALKYIPSSAFWQVAKDLQEGDLIFLVPTADKGVNITHVGMATRKGKMWHLLHASSLQKEVVESKEILAVYLKQPIFRGFLVVRPL